MTDLKAPTAVRMSKIQALSWVKKGSQLPLDITICRSGQGGYNSREY